MLTFKIGDKNGDKEYKVVKSASVVQRTYSMKTSQGYPWMTYVGTDRTAGFGMIPPAGYSKPDKDGSRFLFSVGPWWVDANQAHPGYGSLSIIFFTYVVPNPPGIKHFLFDPSLCYPNMRNMKIRGNIRGHNVDLRGGDFVFWFQCYSERIGKYLNYACIGQPLNDKLLDGNINHFELNIDIGKGDDWVSLGSCDEKSELYGNLELKELSLDTPLDMGFIIVPIDAKPLWNTECEEILPLDLGIGCRWPVNVDRLPKGTIAIYDLEIEYSSNYEIVML